MTSTVLVEANHGWPVRVMPLTADGSAVGPVVTVAAAFSQTFHVHSGQDLLIHEVQPGTAPFSADEPILKFFAWKHLPDHLQAASRPFAMLADRIVKTTPRSPERTVCLRKLLEAKDCAVRAAVPESMTGAD